MPDDGARTASTLEEIPPAERTPIAGVKEALQRRWSRPGGRGYAGLRWGGAGLFTAVAVALVVSLLSSSSQAFAHSGLSLLWTGTWDPTHKIYGAETFIVGTLITTAVALVLAVPIGVATAAFLSELAPRWLATPLSVLIDLIAAVPSIRDCGGCSSSPPPSLIMWSRFSRRSPFSSGSSTEPRSGRRCFWPGWCWP